MRLGWFLLPVLVVSVGRPAHAAGILGISLNGCSSFSEPEVRRIVAAELHVELSAEGVQSPTEVVVTCDGSRVRIRVIDLITRKALTRSFILDEPDPQAWARLVGIAAAELVTASWTELDLPAPRVEPEGPRVPPATAQAALRAARAYGEPPPTATRQPAGAGSAHHGRAGDLRLVALASARSFFGKPGSLWGGGVRLGQDYVSSVGFAVDALVERGFLASSVGHFDASTVTLGAIVFLHYRRGWYALRGGGGVRLGATELAETGEAMARESFALTPWGWPLAAGSFTVRASPGLAIELAGEGSYAMLPVTDSSGIDQPAMFGAWYGVQLGIGLSDL